MQNSSHDRNIALKPDYQPILAHLKLIPYIKVNSLYKKLWSNEVLGFNVSASSLLRKRKTLERINEEIHNYDLPLYVDDYLGDGYCSFRLMIRI